jgi:hypothetical protein
VTSWTSSGYRSELQSGRAGKIGREVCANRWYERFKTVSLPKSAKMLRTSHCSGNCRRMQPRMEQCVHESWTTNGMEKLETRRQPQRFPRSTLGSKASGMVGPLWQCMPEAGKPGRTPDVSLARSLVA